MKSFLGNIAKGVVSQRIAEKVTTRFNPRYIEVINESHKHRVPKDAETHFKLVIVSDEFTNLKTLVEKQRLVYECLSEELNSKVHALSVTCRSPKEWESNQEAIATPPCKSSDEKPKI